MGESVLRVPSRGAHVAPLWGLLTPPDTPSHPFTLGSLRVFIGGGLFVCFCKHPRAFG